MRPGEALAAAVVRELAEETGLEATCGRFVGWAERISERFHFVMLDFEVDVVGPRQPRPGDDALEAAWVPLSELARIDLVDGLIDFLVDNGVTTVS